MVFSKMNGAYESESTESNVVPNKLSMAKMSGAFMGAMSSIAASITMAFAAGGFGVWGNAANITGNLFTTLNSALMSVVVPVAGVIFVICLIMMMVSKEQKKVDTYRTWAITVFVCLIAIFAIPFVINLAKSIGQSF